MVEQYMYHIFFIQSSIKGHFGCFHVSATVSNAAMNVGVHVSLQINVCRFFGRYPEKGLLGHIVPLFLIF